MRVVWWWSIVFELSVSSVFVDFMFASFLVVLGLVNVIIACVGICVLLRAVL